MRKKLPFIIVGFVILVILAALYFEGVLAPKMVRKYIAHMAAPPIAVSATKAVYGKSAPSIDVLGNFVASEGTMVTSEVPGIVTGIYFRSGESVKKGSVLVQLLSKSDNAALKAYQAQEQLAELTYKRTKALFNSGSTPREELDKATADLQKIRATAEQQKDMIDKKTIRAPFDGRVGIRQINVGEYVTPGQAIVPLESFSPIYVDFSVQQETTKLLHVNQSVDITTDVLPNKHFSGKIIAFDSRISPNTRSLMIRSELPNNKDRFFPGMFARVHVEIGRKKRYVFLPQTAVAYAPYGQTVFILKKEIKDGKQITSKNSSPIFVANQVFVKTGQPIGNFVPILKNVSVGDLVVTAGQLKLKNGSKVIVINDTKEMNVQKVVLNSE